MLTSLLRIHDGLTRLTLWMAVAAVAYLTAATAFEVVARYVFDAPTDWAPDTSAIAFAFIAFLAAPELTRVQGHAAMTFAVNNARADVAHVMRLICLVIATLTCAVCAYFGVVETLRQIDRGVTMIAVLPIPKWIVTGAIAYGLTSMSLYFLRDLIQLAGRSWPKEPA